ncbi:carbohydrate ABC transporter permease [Faecalicatena sp. Marseille-Q4148]|nr:carbohydrate ABC transporter permease [Faecalicatena sp. Marseille-Q4148]
MGKTKCGFRKIKSILINVLVMCFSITCIYPIIWMLYSSVKSNPEFNRNILALPTEIHWENYVKAFKMGNIGLYSLNSLFNAVVSAALIIFFAFIVAYFIARYQFRGRKIIYMTFLFGMLVPVHALLVPVFIQYKNFGLFDNRLTLIIPYVALGLPFAIFLMEGFIRTIPKELEEAAYIDGSNFFNTMFKIVFPVCKPTLTTIGILSFLDGWNEFPFSLVLIKSDELKTISLGLLNFNGQYSKDYTVQMAGLIMAMLPIIIIYVIMNKRIIEGMTSGAVKG